jgi:hypothetical protein
MPWSSATPTTTTTSTPTTTSTTTPTAKKPKRVDPLIGKMKEFSELTEVTNVDDLNKKSRSLYLSQIGNTQEEIEKLKEVSKEIPITNPVTTDAPQKEALTKAPTNRPTSAKRVIRNDQTDVDLLKEETDDPSKSHYEYGSDPFLVAKDILEWKDMPCSEFKKYLKLNKKHKGIIDSKENELTKQHQRLQEEIRDLQIKIASKQSLVTKAFNAFKKSKDKQKYEATKKENNLSLTRDLIPALETKNAELEALTQYIQSDSLEQEKKTNDLIYEILKLKLKYCNEVDPGTKGRFDDEVLKKKIHRLIQAHTNITRPGNLSSILGI